jgi:two-component system sensor histidine kinase KdpD
MTPAMPRSTNGAIRAKRLRAEKWAAAFIVLFALTGAMLLVRPQLDKVHVALLFLLVVLFGSAFDGAVLGMSLAGSAFLLFDWFFVPPYNTLGVANPLDWLVLVTFLITSIVAAQLLARAQRRTDEARARTIEVERFSTLGAETLNAADPEDALESIAEVIRATLEVDSCDIYVQRGDAAGLALLAHAGALTTANAEKPEVAAAGGILAWVGDRNEMAVERRDGTTRVGKATDDTRASGDGDIDAGWLPWGDIADARAIAIPLNVRGHSVGVLRVANDPHVDLAPGQRDFLNALSYYAALGIERVQLAADASHADALREADRLKNALLAAVSHDLRTPLTTVKALAHAIVENGAAPDDPNAISIEEEADLLTALITDLLEYSRLAGGALHLTPRIDSADDLVGAALDRSRGILGSREVRISEAESSEVLLGMFDFVHSVRAVVNLLENAAKYSDPGTPIEIVVHREGSDLVILVEDRGIGVATSERERIFEPFYRAPDAPATTRGAGLGLAIARGLALAQGGDVIYEPRLGGGSIFALHLPAAEAPELPLE